MTVPHHSAPSWRQKARQFGAAGLFALPADYPIDVGIRHILAAHVTPAVTRIALPLSPPLEPEEPPARRQAMSVFKPVAVASSSSTLGMAGITITTR